MARKINLQIIVMHLLYSQSKEHIREWSLCSVSVSVVLGTIISHSQIDTIVTLKSTTVLSANSVGPVLIR